VYKITVLDKAKKKLKKLDKKTAIYLISKIYSLENGIIDNNNIKHLSNYHPKYRYRIGNWRVFFNIEKDNIYIHDIRLRKEGY
jgi:mRNA interferase RelE/StbE